MDWHGKIAIDPRILSGKPVIRGTRLSVDFILELLAQGWSEAQIVENYPALDRDGIRACIGYAAEILKSEHVYPTPIPA